jgi:hypothetical protein
MEAETSGSIIIRDEFQSEFGAIYEQSQNSDCA